MHLIYLDESGNTGKDLGNREQPIHFINGIMVDANEIQILEKKLKHLEQLFLPYSQNFNFEFHASDIFSGKGYFKNFSIKERLELIDNIFDIINSSGVQFISYGVNKQYLVDKYKTPYHPHIVAFSFLLEKIDEFPTINGHKGLVIMDRNDESGQKIIDDFQSYKVGGVGFGVRKKAIKNLIDTVYYAESYNSHMLQLSDILGYMYSAFCVSWQLDDCNPISVHHGYVKSYVYGKMEALMSKAYYIGYMGYNQGLSQRLNEKIDITQ